MQVDLFSASLALLFGVSLTACQGVDSAITEQRTVDDWLECNWEATGGDALQKINKMAYRLHIVEPEFTVDGSYVTQRDVGLRMDVYMAGERVISEGWTEEGAWLLPAGATKAQIASAEGAENLRHGYELPGHFWTLKGVRENGAQVALDGYEDREGISRPIIKVTLPDKFESWYLLDPENCLIRASRSFRSFHPDMGTESHWIEARYNDFRATQGILKPFLKRSVDLRSGKVIATARVLELKFDGAVPAVEFYPPLEE